ncbi:MAG: DJ-1/PfpI family protein [Bacteroidales bacterium]|nr:DJ-1/PfpI family protein [Bacteroidales bacterium]
MAKKVTIVLADGFEETEALAPADLLRRAGIEVTLLTINNEPKVTSSHKITVIADSTLSAGFGDYDLIILPGGMPGTKNLFACQPLTDELKRAYANGKRIAAICAAPMILGQLGMLRGRRATAFPGFEQYLDGASAIGGQVVTDGPITTGIGAGAALDFGLELISVLDSADKAKQIAEAIIMK